MSVRAASGGGGKPKPPPPVCRKALKEADRPKDECPPCDYQQPPSQGNILQRFIKLKFIDGGTNFGTPFRMLGCSKQTKNEQLPAPAPKPPAPESRAAPLTAVPVRPQRRGRGIQVAVLGAETRVGQYLSLLLKQSPCIKKLCLYDARECQPCAGVRDSCYAASDLQIINTSCKVEAFCSCTASLNRCLQNSDLVLLLESGQLSADTSFENRFTYQAPVVKRYAAACAQECPTAVVVVCATPVDCMVPVVAESFKEVGFFDPRKILGSMALPEMRANTLVSRALSLDPRCTRVPCVGGSEGPALVPLYSKTVEHFNFAEHNADMLTQAVRCATTAVARAEKCAVRAAALSEAHALSGLATRLAHALLCHDKPLLSAYVANDSWQFISPARYFANDVRLDCHGVCMNLGIPKLSRLECDLVELALEQVSRSVELALSWHGCQLYHESLRDADHLSTAFAPKHYRRLETCVPCII